MSSRDMRPAPRRGHRPLLILPHIQILHKNLGQILRVGNAPVVSARELEALQLHHMAKAARFVEAFELVVLILEIDMRLYPVVLQAVQLAVLNEHALIEAAPGTKQVIFALIHANPFGEALNDFWKSRSPVHIHLSDGGQFLAEMRQLRVNHRLDETVERIFQVAVVVQFQGADFYNFLYHSGRSPFPAGGFQIVDDEFHGMA